MSQHVVSQVRYEGTAHLAMLSVAWFYGLNYFIAKFVFAEVTPFALLALRSIFGAGFFVIASFYAGRERIQSRRDWGLLILCGLFGAAINQLLFLWGLSKTTEVNAAVLMVTSPLFVFLLAWVLREENMTRRKILGLVTAFSGAVLLITAGRQLSLGGDTITGDLMVMCNAASYGVYLVLVRPLMQRYKVVTIIKWVLVFGAIANIPIGTPDLMAIDWSQTRGITIWGVAYVIIFVTIGAYGLNAWAMRRVPASYVGMYIYMQPVIVTILSYIWVRDSLSVEKLVYITLVLVGVIVVSYRKRTG